MTEEVWKEFLPGYSVSSLGRIRDTIKDIDRKTFGNRGYRRICIRRGPSLCVLRLSVHRLVAGAFIPNPLGLPQVNHKDGNKGNNVVENLEWANASQNAVHAFNLGLRKPVLGKKNGASKLTDETVEQLRRDRLSGKTLDKIAADYGISPSLVSLIANRKIWTHVN